MNKGNNNYKRRYGRKLDTSSGIDSIISSISKNPKILGRLNNYKEFLNWPKIVGDEIAKHSKPIKVVKDRVLVIKVSSPSLAQELSLRKDIIFDYFNTLEKGFSIEELRFICTNPNDFK